MRSVVEESVMAYLAGKDEAGNEGEMGGVPISLLPVIQRQMSRQMVRLTLDWILDGVLLLPIHRVF